MVHFTGTLRSTENSVTDSEFAITVRDAARVKRVVEMFQFREKVSTTSEDRVGGSRVTRKGYSYTKEWSSVPISSSGFHDHSKKNPSMPVESTIIGAKSLSVGRHLVGDVLASQLDCSEVHPLTEVSRETEDKIFRLNLASDVEGVFAHVMSGNWLFIGENPHDPMVGDLRIQYKYAPLGTVSVMAQQGAFSLERFETPNGIQIGMISRGEKSVAQMCAAAEQANVFLAWVLRVVGFALTLLSVNLILGPISEVLRFLPFLTTIMSILTSIGAFVFASVYSLLVIAMAWIFYRPILGFTLLALGATLLAYRLGYLGGPSVVSPVDV